VPLANKLACTVWAVWTKKTDFRGQAAGRGRRVMVTARIHLRATQQTIACNPLLAGLPFGVLLVLIQHIFGEVRKVW
jgi:hypothetical protein